MKLCPKKIKILNYRETYPFKSMLNSGLNPLAYGMTNREFRKYALSLLCRRPKKSSGDMSSGVFTSTNEKSGTVLGFGFWVFSIDTVSIPTKSLANNNRYRFLITKVFSASLLPVPAPLNELIEFKGLFNFKLT